MPLFNAGAQGAHFLWLRLSRAWPIYLVTMHIAAQWIIFTLHVGTTPSPTPAVLCGKHFHTG